MSAEKVPGKRGRYIYEPASTQPFKLSRTKLELLQRCPRCFYLDIRLGVGQPKGYPFTLNTAVDTLLKKEFDEHRKAGTKHKLCEQFGIDAVPLDHEQLDIWRETFAGIQHLHQPTNFLVYGAVDDIWVTPRGEWLVVDYKATSTKREITLDDEWKMAFKRQMEVYQWLLRRLGQPVADRGYFVYCNGMTDRDVFDGKLEFEISVLPHDGDDAWVEDAVRAAHQVLVGGSLPAQTEGCSHCDYREAAKLAGA